MHIAIIPARGGSQRIPRKNIREFLGVPALSITISNAIKSELFTDIFVSTDDEEIADVASKSGAKVPFLRDTKLSDNFTGTLDVIRDFVIRMNLSKSMVTCLYPVTPLLNYQHISTAVMQIESLAPEYVFPAIKMPVGQNRMFSLSSQGRVILGANAQMEQRTQDLPSVYADAGQFYTGKGSTWTTTESIIGPKSFALPLNPYEVIDIDSEEDWIFAEELFRLRNPEKMHSGRIKLSKVKDGDNQ